MSTVAAEMMLQCVCDGSLSMSDMDIERRPQPSTCALTYYKKTDLRLIAGIA
ncbi:hypothetical protein RND71_005556 [Anisodus tanguticus]|uniref:Uncharacterized protein n=1 Tax=Anisodus tanguticus TaxID=243964 RepID=A0AAE1SQA1_9SOLA|nr:hypothetical protein RND71_005556 [Anisodus tanguticus]